MVIVSFQAEKNDLLLFQQKVGKGNVSESLRNYMLACIGVKNEKEDALKKQLLRLEPQIKEAERIKAKLREIELKKEIERKKQEDFMKEQERRLQQAKGQMMKDHLHRVV